MKASALLLSVLAGSLVVACGSTVSLEDLACPCATGFVCCDKECVAEGSCGGAKLVVDGSDDAGGGVPGFTPAGSETSPSGGSGFGYATDGGAGGQSANHSQPIVTSGGGGSSSTDGTASGGTVDGGTGGPPSSAYCYYASDAGSDRYDCVYENDTPQATSFGCGCAGTQGNTATAAQTDLNCMSGGGTIVAVCPSAGLVGCCTSSYGSWGGLPPYTTGTAVACSYGVDDHYELSCVANGGTWSTTAPR